MIKSPLYPQTIEPNGTSWISDACKPERRQYLSIPTISEEDYEYILNHCEAKYCFVSDAEVLRKNDISSKTI